jgi:hypothetical protein
LLFLTDRRRRSRRATFCEIIEAAGHVMWAELATVFTGRGDRPNRHSFAAASHM